MAVHNRRRLTAGLQGSCPERSFHLDASSVGVTVGLRPQRAGGAVQEELAATSQRCQDGWWTTPHPLPESAVRTVSDRRMAGMPRSAVPAVDAPRREYVDESRW